MFLSVHVPEHSKQYTSQHKRKWEILLTAGSHMLVNTLRFAAMLKQRGRSSEVLANICLVIFWIPSRTFQDCRTCENSLNFYFLSIFLLRIETTSVRCRPNNTSYRLPQRQKIKKKVTFTDYISLKH